MGGSADDDYNREECIRLQAEVERLDKLAQGYYNEASEGWSKFRRAELQVGELMSLLKKYEWADSSGPESVKICPECGQDKDYGHNNDCILAKVVGSDRYHHPNESPPEKRVIESRIGADGSKPLPPSNPKTCIAYSYTDKETGKIVHVANDGTKYT